MPRRSRSRPCTARLAGWVFIAAAGLPALGGCGYIRGKAIGMVADTLASGGDVFTRDDDPELVAEALPFALKLYESLLESSPDNRELLLATCSAFTQYGVAFVEHRATLLNDGAHHDDVVRLRARAFKLYGRAHGYCMRAMEQRFKGIGPKLIQRPEAALAAARPGRKDVPLLYWTAAAWGSQIALALDRPEISIDLPVVRALAERALALDPGWNRGALHEMMISIDGQSGVVGGSPEAARRHFARAVELQKGRSPGPYIALATTVVVAAQDRAEFERLLQQALAIDPEQDPASRLVVLLQQEKARALLGQIDRLIPRTSLTGRRVDAWPASAWAHGR